MTPIEWLIAVALAVLVWWVIAGVVDSRSASRDLPVIHQPVRHAPPPLPGPSRLHVAPDRVRAASSRPAKGSAGSRPVSVSPARSSSG